MNVICIKAIARKEFFHLFRDYRSLYLAFALPLMLIVLFGYALSLDVENVTTVVVDQDQSDLSRDVLRQWDASPYFRIVAHAANVRDASLLLDRGDALLALIFPPDWSARLRADRNAPLQVLVDGSDPNYANISIGYVNAFFERQNLKLLRTAMNKRGITVIPPPLEGRIRIWFNEDLESRNFIIPGIIAVIIMIVGAMLTSLVIAREYESGTMETLKSLPIHATELIIGKAIPYFLITLIDVLISVFLGQVLFGVVMKSSFWILMTGASLYLMVALSLGLWISAVTQSQLIANQVAPLTTFLPSLLLSDFVFPVINMPTVLQWITYLVPARYFIDILKGVYMKNLGWWDLVPAFGILAAMAMILSLLTLAKLKREGL